MIDTRPQNLDELVGLKDIKDRLMYESIGAKLRNSKPPSYILTGPPGLGKTTIAHILSKNIGSGKGTVHRHLGADISSPDELYGLLQTAKDDDVFFIEEAHCINRKVDSVLLPLIEEGKILGGQDWGLLIPPKVSFIFSTTSSGRLSHALRTRCKSIHLGFYNVEDLKEIIRRAAIKYNVEVNDDEGLTLLAQSSRGTPRIAVEHRLESVLNVMAVDNVPFSKDVVQKSLKLNNINDFGLERNDMDYCDTLYRIQSQTQRPVSVKTLTQALGLADDVVVTIESYLQQIGVIQVMSKGRILTEAGCGIIGKPPITTTINEIFDKVENTQNPQSETKLDDLISRIESGEFKTLKDISQAYSLPYPTSNSVILEKLSQIGYTSKQRKGICKISNFVV